MDGFLNRMKAQSASLDQAMAQPRFGIVSSVDPTNYTAKVRLQPEDVLTGWLPVLTPWSGSGWGMVCPPSPGDQVLVVAQEGDAEHGVIVGRSYSLVQMPPTDGTAPAPAGEFWLVHRSGSYLRLRNDGSIEAKATVWRLQGDLQVSGDVSDGHGSLNGLRQNYDGHRHTDSVGGKTSTADLQD